MKRYVLLVGGTGARLADALIVAASAGVFPAEKLNVLLADTDRRGVQGASLVSAKMADYARIHQAMTQKDGPFRTDVAFSSWPERLPENASTLAEYTADSEVDALLCQAFFDENAANLDLHEGFHGRRALGMVTYAGLLHEADQDHTDVLSCLVDEMAEAAQSGEEVRVVLAGSICGGTGAAGIAALTRYIRQRVETKINIGAVLLHASDDAQDAAHANETLAAYAAENLLETVCVLGLPKASRTTAPAEYAHLADWLTVYCMDVLLHRPQWLTGVFTVQSPEGPLSWEIFGKAAQRYRLCTGGLMKFAALWVSGLSAKVEKRLAKPFFLRDELFGWYAHFFRRTEDKEEQLDLVEPLNRLMNVALIWLGGVCKSLPIDLRNASQVMKARAEAENHYAQTADLASRLTLMDADAEQAELYQDNLVYRGKNNAEAAEAEATIKRIAAAKQEIARRENAQVTLNRRMGGAAAMDMLYDALDAAQTEADELRERHEEAIRRIDYAEQIAAAEDQYRITDARTKLQRMERHQLMVEARLARTKSDVARFEAEGLRFEKPAMAAAPAENSMFLQEAADMAFKREKMTRKAVETLWPRMVCPGNTLTVKQCMKAVCKAKTDKSAPLMSLVQAMVENAMKEV
nr:hypothetical protein [Clostridia bacterium]